jgi:TatD DNase family protein
MIDTHCHLTEPRLFEQLEGVISRARAAGVSRMITIGTNVQDARAAIKLCRGRDDLRCAIGIHPNYTQDATLDDVPVIRQLQQDPGVVAVGEMGLDYFHHFADRKHQAALFDAQLSLAAELGRPVVIHSRDAIADTLAMMAKYPSVRGVFHCFTGTAAEAESILSASHLISFTGPVTYKKNDTLRDVVKLVPLNRMMVETDAPYLSPEPLRKQKINEPSLVVHTAATVAAVKGVSVEEVDDVTTQVARAFFGWG